MFLVCTKMAWLRIVDNRVTLWSKGLHPGLLVEIGGKEPACFVRQHRVYADSEIGRIAECLSGKMRAENIVPDRISSPIGMNTWFGHSLHLTSGFPQTPRTHSFRHMGA